MSTRHHEPVQERFPLCHHYAVMTYHTTSAAPLVGGVRGGGGVGEEVVIS
jgi:hypothetical protein